MKKIIIIICSIVVIILAAGVSWLVFIQPSTINETTHPSTSTTNPVKVQPSFVDQQLAGMSLSQKVAGLLILHSLGTDAAALQQFLQTYQTGGLIFMGDNIPAMGGEGEFQNHIVVSVGQEWSP